MDVELPNGLVIEDVPDGTTKAELVKKLRANGIDVPKEWMSESTSGPGKVFAKRAGLGVLPGVGGLAGAEAGALAGAGLGTLAFPGAGTAVGSILGAIVGGVGGGMLTGKAQEKILEAMPETRAALGVDPETLAKEEEAHGAAAMLGNLAGQAVSMRPSVSTLRQAFGKGTAEEVMRARALMGGGAGVGGALTAGMQQLEDPGAAPDWKEIAEGTLAGGFLTKPTKRVGEPVSRVARRLAGEKVPRPAPTQPSRPPAVDATTRPPAQTGEGQVLYPSLQEGTPPADRTVSATAADLIQGGMAPPATDVPPSRPSVKTPPAETPPAETPPAETPPAETPPAETPPAETPPAETPPAETPPAETPPAETPPAETPPAETPPAKFSTPPTRRLDTKEFPAADEAEHASAIDALPLDKYVVMEGFKKFRNSPADSVFHIYDTKDEAIAAAGRMERKTSEKPAYIDIIYPDGRRLNVLGALKRTGQPKFGVPKTRLSRPVEQALVRTETRRIEQEFASYPENFAGLPRAAQLEAFDLVGKDFDPSNVPERDAVTTKLEELGLNNKDIDWLIDTAENRAAGKRDVPVADIPVTEEGAGAVGYENTVDFEQNPPLSTAERPATKPVPAAENPVEKLLQDFSEGRLPTGKTFTAFDSLVNALREFGIKSRLLDQVMVRDRLLDQVLELDPRNTKLSPKTTAQKIWELLKPYYGEAPAAPQPAKGKTAPKITYKPRAVPAGEVKPLTAPLGELAGVTPETAPGGKPAADITIDAAPNPTAFSSLVRSQHGEPISLIARNSYGEEVGRLTYMPKGGPIDVFVREQNRRQGVGTALYNAFEAAGGKLPSLESGVILSDAARALRASRKDRETAPGGKPKAGTPQQQSLFESPQGRASAESGLKQPTHTLESIAGKLKSTFGIHTDRLFKNGFLNVVASVKDLPEGVTVSSPTSRAFYHVPTNKVYFIAENIPQGYNLKGLMLHETGVHAGMETMLGTPTFEKLLKEVADRAAAGEKPFKEASDRVPYTTPEANVDEERLAYLVSDYKDLPFVKRIYSQLRQWLYNKMGGRFITLSNDDIQAMAVASLKRVSDLAETGRTGELRRDAALAARTQRAQESEAARVDAANRELSPVLEEFAENASQPLTDAEKNKLDQEAAVRDERRKITRKTIFGRLKNWFEDTKRDPYETQVRLFQDARRLLLLNDRRERAAGRLSENAPGLHALATATPSKLEGLRTAPVQKQLVDAIQGYMQRAGLADIDVLAQFNRWMHGLTEPDLRKWLFVRYTPLRDAMVTLADGRKINPAEAREVVAKAYETSNDLTAPDARQKYGYNADDLRNYMDYLAQNFAEAKGFTPDDAPPSIKTSLPDRNITDIDHPAYDLTGVSQETAARWRAELEQQLAGEFGPDIQRVLDAEKALREEVVRLEKLNGHWGSHVDNAIAVMRRGNYYTLKGDANRYNFDTLTGTRLRGELGRVQGEMGGRTSMSDNPLTQTIADSNVALSRLDKKDFLDELYRQAKEGLLRDPRRNNTRVLKVLDSIEVGKRNDYELPLDVSPESIVLRPDGKGGYDVIQVKDDKWREAIKGIVTTQNFAMDLLGKGTRGIASLATRWNATFGPVNSVRDLSTNMSTIGAEYGYATGLKVGIRFLTQAVKGSAAKAARVANLVAKNDIATLEKLAAKDPYINNLYSLMKEGGSTSYNSAFSNETATIQVVDELKSRGVTGATKKTLTHLADVYNNMFEYMNREAAYDTLRKKFAESGGTDVNKRAALETLNLMNPALSGIYTKSLSSWFAFFRASATGAVRGVDSVLMPLFMTPEEWVRKTYGSKFEIDTNASIDRILRDPAQRQKALQYWEQRRKNAFLLAISSLGFGYAMREASKMLSDENEKGENRVATDNPSLWTRSLRIPTTILGPYKNALGSDIHFINIPWGYGAGSFAAIGAQMSGMASGDYKPFDAARNMVGVSKDSFLPIPTEDWSLFNRNPVGGVVASAAPTPIKPVLYFAFNADYFGRQIYNTRLGRYADAYSGGDYVPEDFKDLSKTLYEASNGEVDIAPQSFQFFANNYFSGAANLLQSASGAIRTVAGQKDFSPKTDIPGLGGFLGVESDADARAFGDVERNIQKIKTKLSTFENTNNAKAYEKFVREHPDAPYLVRRYDLTKNRINRYTKMLNDIRASEMSIKERKERVDEIRKMRSLYLKSMNDAYKVYEDRN